MQPNSSSPATAKTTSSTTASEGGGKTARRQQSPQRTGVSDVYQWPVGLALLPPLLSLYYGGSVQAWNEYFMLLVVAFYLYALVKGNKPVWAWLMLRSPMGAVRGMSTANASALRFILRHKNNNVFFH